MPASPYALKLRAAVQAATEALAAAQREYFEYLDDEADHPDCVALKTAAFAWGVEYQTALKRCQRNPDLFVKTPDGRWMVPIAMLPS